MFSYPPHTQRPTFRSVLRTFGQGPNLPLAELLPEKAIQQACDEEGACFAQGDKDVWTPALTLWALLSQCVSDSKSCVAAVARSLVLRVSLGLPPCSEATGAYCKARAKLPVPLLRRLTARLGDELERQAPPSWRWKGRRVLLADGTTASGPDTPENQAGRHSRRVMWGPLCRQETVSAQPGTAPAPAPGVGPRPVLPPPPQGAPRDSLLRCCCRPATVGLPGPVGPCVRLRLAGSCRPQPCAPKSDGAGPPPKWARTAS